jgi:hypothetical protein
LLRNCGKQFRGLAQIGRWHAGVAGRANRAARPARRPIADHLVRHGRPRAPSGFTILRSGEADLPDVVHLEHLTSVLSLDKRSDVDRYLLAMEWLSIINAMPGETHNILTAIINQLEE